MSSDVINYLDNENDVKKAFKNISDAMDKDSVFIFDFLRIEYLNSLDNYHEDIELEDTIIKWNIEKTSNENQVKHTLEMDDVTETHIQSTYSLKKYKQRKRPILKPEQREDLFWQPNQPIVALSQDIQTPLQQ